jgi:hypothetical protein
MQEYCRFNSDRVGSNSECGSNLRRGPMAKAAMRCNRLLASVLLVTARYFAHREEGRLHAPPYYLLHA